MDIEELKSNAENGDPEALFQLGLMYYKGENVEKHITNAIDCWKRLTESDNQHWAIRGCQQLSAYYYQDGTAHAMEWIEKELSLGSDEGGLFVATRLFKEEKYEEGLNVLMKLAKAGSEKAIDMFIYYYSEAGRLQVSLPDEQLYFMSQCMAARNKTQEENRKETVTNNSSNKTKKYLTWGALAILAVIMLWLWICPCVVIVDENHKHRKECGFADIEYVNQKGERIVITGHKAFNNYIYNASDKMLNLYETLYTNDNDAAESFEPESYSITPGKLSEVKSIPDFYFTMPNEIEVVDHWIVALFHGIFGGEKIKWIIDYNEWTQEEIIASEKVFIKNHELKNYEYTDGRIIFRKPVSFNCKKMNSSDSTSCYHVLESDVAHIIIVSDYWQGVTPSEEEFMAILGGWKDAELDYCKMEEQELMKTKKGGTTYFSKKIVYKDEQEVTWKFILCSNETAGKDVVVSVYTTDPSKDYIDEILQSIQYE